MPIQQILRVSNDYFTDGNRRVVFGDHCFPLGGNLAGEARGYTYTCPHCGEQWGKLFLGKTGQWVNVTWSCQHHGNPANIGGSFLKPLLWWDRQFSLENASIDFLLHEALVKAAQILKGS